MTGYPNWLEDLLTWPTLDDWTPRFDHVDLESAVRRRMRSDEHFRAVLAEVLADANLTITYRRWQPSDLLPLPLAYA